MTLSESALAFATQAHKGQKRWDRKTPYITHPIAVAEITKAILITGRYTWNNAPSEYFEPILSAAYLHDVAEDCQEWEDMEEDIVTEVFSLSDCHKHSGSPFFLHNTLRLLNKHRHANYLDFVLAARSYLPARIVKIADITHNLSDLKKGSMKDKYQLALHILET